MATLAAGNSKQVYVPLDSDVTITPEAGGYVDFGCSSTAETPPAGRRVVAEETISTPAGSVLFLRAEGAGASYTVLSSALAGTGTVTNTGGTLTSNAVILGAGVDDIKKVAGITSDGISKIKLGVAGSSVGAIELSNATSGTITIQPATGALGTVTLTAPAATGTIATTDDVTAAISGLSWKQAVRAATTAAGTLATSFENGDTIDGAVLATNDRILVKDQAAGAENGIYIVQASGAPVRSTDADTGAELLSASCFVSAGTANANTQWTCTTPATITPDTTALTFVQLSSGGATVATDTIWDAAGDTVYGTGANTSARLAKGTALQVYRMNAGETAPEWASLPASGATDATAATILALTTGDEGEIYHANSSSGDVVEDGYYVWNENAGELQQLVAVTPDEATAISDGYQGLLTVAAMMALTGVEGMTCSLSGVGNRVPYARYDASAGKWRPLGGRQLIFRLAAIAGQTTGPGNTTPALLAGCQCTVPADLISADGMGIAYRAAGEKLDGSAGESPTMTVLWGSLGTTSDTVLHGPFTFTTASVRQIPLDGAFVRRSATTVQLVGTGSITVSTRWSNSPNSAFPAAVASGNMDSADNYLSLIATGTGAGAQYVAIHQFDVYWEG